MVNDLKILRILPRLMKPSYVIRQLGSTDEKSGKGLRLSFAAERLVYAATKAGISTSDDVSLTVPTAGSKG